MKLAIFTKSTVFHKGYGGFETQNKVLSEGLVKRGHKVVIYSPKKELEVSEVVENGVCYKFVECRFGSFKTLYSRAKDSWENKSIERFIPDHAFEKYDLVIGQSSWALPIIKIKNKLNVKVVSILHGSKIGEFQTEIKNIGGIKDLIYCIRDVPHVLRAFFVTQREFVHGSDKLVAVSNFVKKTIIEETYVSDEKVEVIFNGIDGDSFSYVDRGDRSLKNISIIYTGRVIKAKGIFLLLEALSNIKLSPWNLTVVGDGPSLGQFKEKVSEIGLNSRVFIKGLLKHEDVIRELSESDIFVLPSMRMEGFPMTIVEAMFSGLPVIASDIGGNSDAVIDGETGYLCKPGDKEDLQEKLQQLINNSSLRISLGKNGRKKAGNEFTIDNMLDKYESIFKGVLE